jgi:D-alanine-D-alanine ligase
MKLKLGLVYDLRKDYLAEGFTQEQVGEFDSESTIAELEQAIRGNGHGVERIGHGRALCRRLVAGDRWDLIFTIAEGMYGRSREAQVPCLLEMYGLPYTFSDALVCAVTLDKAVAKRLVQGAGVNTPRFAVIERSADIGRVALRYPLFAKPIAEGTGKGVDRRSKIRSAAELSAVCRRLLRRFKQPVLVEEYLPGREFTTGILGTGAQARVLGTMEVRVKPGAPAADYSFEVKELCEEFVDYVPMEHGALRRAVEAMALASYRALECRDAARVDIRLDARKRPSFMELNPLPGLHPRHSDLPMIATQAGMAYVDLIGAIIDSAARRITAMPATVRRRKA